MADRRDGGASGSWSRSTRALLALAAVLVAGIAYVVALVVLGKLADDDNAVFGPLFRANLGLVFTTAYAVGVLAAIARRIAGLSWQTILVGLGALLLAGLGLGAYDVAERASAPDVDPSLARQIDPRVDAFVLVELSDPGAATALHDWSIQQLLAHEFPPLPDTTGWDPAFGVGIDDGSGVRLVQPLTTMDDARDAARRLLSRAGTSAADLPLIERRSAASDPRVGWRTPTGRTIARVLLPGDDMYSVEGCVGPRTSHRVVVIVPDSDPGACGFDEATVLAAPGEDVFDVVLNVLTGQASASDKRMAFAYRPLLYFDSEEFYRPLDADALLSEREGNEAKHEICDERVLRPNDCDDLESAADLVRLPDHINLSGELRYGRDARTGTDLIEDARSLASGASSAGPSFAPPGTPSPPSGPPPGVPPPGSPGAGPPSFCTPTPDDRECDGGPWSRLYYHLRHAGDLLHIDYWWYFRFNVSPVKTWAMCLSGFSVTERSCYDHESDWEGVTITVRRIPPDDNALPPPPESVTYAGHNWRFRFRWSQLEARWRELLTPDFGVDTGIRARVYVAFGSHASYPLPCHASQPDPLETDLACWQGDHNQELFGLVSIPLPDGRRDGQAAWSMNTDQNCEQVACVTPLPVTRNGRPARWNAYTGRWGKGECALGARLLCVRSGGPWSPSEQDRYKRPGTAKQGKGLAGAGTGN